jgi:hypothetical protein
MNNPDHISESLETIFFVKILKFFNADPGSGMEKFRIQDGKIRIWDPRIIFPRPWKQFFGLKYLNSFDVDPGWKNSDPGSGINIRDPQRTGSILVFLLILTKKNLCKIYAVRQIICCSASYFPCETYTVPMLFYLPDKCVLNAKTNFSEGLNCTVYVCSYLSVFLDFSNCLDLSVIQNFDKIDCFQLLVNSN